MKEIKLVSKQGFRMWKSGKIWLTSGAVAGVAVVALAGGTVKADENTAATTSGAPTTAVTAPAPAATTAPAAPVAATTTPAPAATTPAPAATAETPAATTTAPATSTAPAEPTGVAVTEGSITNDTATGLAANNLKDAAAGRSEEGKQADSNAGKVTGETSVSIDHKEVTDAAKKAEGVGVKVVQDPTSVAPTASNASQAEKSKGSIVAKEHAKAEELKSTATAHSTAMSNWTAEKNSVVKANEDLNNAHKSAVEAYNKFVSTLDADTAAVVAKHKDAIIKTTEKVQNLADGSTVEGYQAYIKSLADQQALNKQAIADYLAKKAEFDATSAKAKATVAENASLSASVVAKNNSLSASVVAKNNSLSASAIAETASRSNSAKAENERLSLSAQKATDGTNATASNAAKKVNDEANAYNKSVMEAAGLQWTGDYAKDSATVEAYNSKKSKEANSSEDPVFNGGYDRNQALPAAANGYTPSGSSTMLSKVEVAPGIEAIATGDLTQHGAKVHLRGDNVNPAKIITKVNWGNVELEGDNKRTFVPGDNNDIWGNTYGYASGGANRFYIVNQLQWYKIPNGATTMDGTVHDLWVMFHKDATGLHPAYQTGEVAVWNANGAVNAIDGGTEHLSDRPGDGIRAVYSLDTPDNHDSEVLWMELIADIDGGQMMQDIGGMKILGVGGGFATDSVVTNNPRVDEQLGYEYGIGRNDKSALDGYNSSPDGTLLAIGSGLFTYVVRNTPGGNSTGVARADFGGDATTSVAIVKKFNPITLKPLTSYNPGKSEYTPVTFKPAEFTPEKFTPENFTPKEVPNVPQAPTLSLTKLTDPAKPKLKEVPKEPATPTVHYNLTALNVNTPVDKSVENEDGVDINGQSVAKGSVNVFKLSPKALSAGRPVTESIVNSDYIDNGLETLVDKVKEDNSKAYDVTYDATTRLLTIKANASEIARANADRSKEYTPTPIKVTYKVLNDAAMYENTFKMDVNGGATTGKGYTSYSNKVRIYTPGKPNNPNDPQNPNGGGNHKIQPVKNNTNKEGKNINGKTLLQNDVNYYVAEWDMDQYINDKSSKSAIAEGFGYLDNPQDDALEGIEKDFKAVDAKGNDVTKELNFYKADSAKLSELPEEAQKLIKKSGIDVSNFGTFYIWTAKDNQAFYDKYVKTGTDIFFNLPMSIKKGFTGDYTNQTWQIDFGNGYTGNIVKNDVPGLTPKKDVIVDGKSSDGATVAYGQEFQYLLNGAVIPGNRGEALWEYKYLDDYDQTGDKFLGTYTVKATTDVTVAHKVTLTEDTTYKEDVTLEDGTVVKAGQTVRKGSVVKVKEVLAKGTDLTKYTTMEHNATDGIVTIAFKEDFLASIVDDSKFGADAALDFKRIAYGTFENTYINRVNGVDYISNTVKTTTPKPETPKPNTPTPNTPTPNTPTPAPAPEKKVLPHTGEEKSAMGVVGGLMALMSLVGIGMGTKRTKED